MGCYSAELVKTSKAHCKSCDEYIGTTGGLRLPATKGTTSICGKCLVKFADEFQNAKDLEVGDVLILKGRDSSDIVELEIDAIKKNKAYATLDTHDVFDGDCSDTDYEMFDVTYFNVSDLSLYSEGKEEMYYCTGVRKEDVSV